MIITRVGKLISNDPLSVARALKNLDTSLDSLEETVSDYSRLYGEEGTFVSGDWSPSTKREVNALYTGIVNSLTSVGSAITLVYNDCASVSSAVALGRMQLTPTISLRARKALVSGVIPLATSVRNKWARLKERMDHPPLSNLKQRSVIAVKNGEVTLAYLSRLQAALNASYGKVFGEAAISSLRSKVLDTVREVSDFVSVCEE